MSRKYSQCIYHISHGLAKRNILYVKLFQAISLNNQFIDEEINNQLLQYTDSAPYSVDDVNCELIIQVMQQYNLKSKELFLKPINSGMISLVYKVLNDKNENIILKVKRHNIDTTLNNALERLQFFVYILSCIPYFNTFNIPSTINKNILLLREQLDFTKEVKNTLEISNLCKDIHYIKIPRIYEEVTKEYPDIIMMEYIDGQHILQVNKKDYEIYAKLVLKYGFVSLMYHGVTHGDLHSGNILFIKNEKKNDSDTTLEYQIGLIDFGIIIKINKQMTEMFLDAISDVFSESGRVTGIKLLPYMISNFDTLPNHNKQHVYDEIGEIIDKVITSSKEANQLKIYEFFHKFNTYLSNEDFKKYDISVSDDFIKLQMGLAMSHGVSMHLCNEDYMIFANKVICELFHMDLLYCL
uniref:ABC1 atypical kinase-like domain-containing protein n=1 Tax=viral metagenome TaxID=1070528 RepID=A0A6C0B1A6_9ZZZZ